MNIKIQPKGWLEWVLIAACSLLIIFIILEATKIIDVV